jgi:hypothetical protein
MGFREAIIALLTIFTDNLNCWQFERLPKSEIDIYPYNSRQLHEDARML